MNRQKSYQSNGAKLYLVATPIGNLGDITYRAVETLKMEAIFITDLTSGKLLFLSQREIVSWLVKSNNASSVCVILFSTLKLLIISPILIQLLYEKFSFNN